MICSMKKDVFLSNKANKQRFITLLSSHLQQTGIGVINAEADADVQVAQTSIDSAASNDTVLVGDDRDLLILLCCNSKTTNCELYFRPEPKSNSQRAARCWNIEQMQRVLGDQICDNLLFTHVLLGCDTTSRVFGIGKPVALKKLRSNAFFREQAAVFEDPDATHWSACTMANLVTSGIQLGCNISNAKFQPASHVCNLGHCHQHQLQPSTIAYVCTTKFSNGVECTSALQNGDGG